MLTSCATHARGGSMDRSRWISLVIVALYVAVDVFVLVPHFKSGAPSEGESFPGQYFGSILAAVAFGLIWWPDFVGAVLLGARYGPLQDTWTGVVRFLGWILLGVAIAMRLSLVRAG